MDALNIFAWEGRTETATAQIGAGLAAQIHATLGRTGPAPRAGDPLPPLWHWCAFTPLDRTDELSRDGHPRLGSFLPPLHQQRRMWAGGALDFRAPLAVGEDLTRTSTVLKIEQKGDAAPMVFVTVGHTISGPRGIAVEERQTIVYLDMPDSFQPPRKRAMPQSPEHSLSHPIQETTLFRFSAVTFNAHRVHYDAAYARDVEKYPGLVIHGPLQAMLLMDLACKTRAACPDWFEFRGVHPMFLGADLDLTAEDDGEGGLTLCAGQSGHQGTRAAAGWSTTL